ncbi:MAG: transglycosylase domain-containing protein [Hespellia sp.]|nr:transglycosylase domain-containing protein [Hespellia sp.]
MNYGKTGASKRQKDISSKTNMKKKRVGVRLFKALVICALLAMIIGVAGGALFVKKILDDTPNVSPEEVVPQGYTTFVRAEDGTELERFVTGGSNRIYKTLDEIPADLGNAFIAIEDSRFLEHNGIDMQGILRAGVVGLMHGGNFSEGASTLTQQLIKNNVFTKFTEEKTFYDRLERKIQEQFLAVEIEKQMSKDQILEAYMNTINLGQNCLGVQSAAMRYFNKNVSDLTLSECAVIAGITQNPTAYDPVVYPEDNATRRNKVLSDMLKQKLITQEAYDEAMADDVYSRIQATSSTADDSPYSYFIDELSSQVIDDLQTKLGYSYTQAYNALYSGGLTITATQDPTIQAIVDEEAANDYNYPGEFYWGVELAATVTRADGTVENYSTQMLSAFWQQQTGEQYPLIFNSQEEAQEAVNAYIATFNVAEGDYLDQKVTFTPQPQTSVVVMDQHTGEVKAILGGRGAKESSLSYNRATEATRQPGSCFKILAAYAPALDTNTDTLATVIDDAAYETTDTHNEIKNWYAGYKGNVTVRKAIEQSINVAACKTIAAVGTQTAYNYLTDFGISTLVDGKNEDYPGFTDIQEVTAIGGITRGVYNIDMTAAFASIANNGLYNEPILYTQILDHDGEVLIDNTPDQRQVIKDSTAGLLTSAMQDVMNQGTGTTAKMSNMPVAGKTGTSDDGEGGSKDIWLSAYTPYYTCTVWGGYDNNMPLSDTVWHEILWKSIMERIHANLAYQDFAMPASIEQATICSQTGLLATSSCSGITEYFAKDSLPTQTCPGHASTTKNNTTTNNNSNNNSTTDGTTTTTPDSGTDTSGGTGGSTGGGTDTGGGTGGGTDTGGGTGGETGGGTGGETGGGTGGGDTGGGTTTP